MALPPFDRTGDLPPGVHHADLDEVLDRLGGAPAKRRAVAQRLARIYRLAVSTGHLARFIVFGSFVTAKDEPGDVDVFLLMDDAFRVADLTGEARVLFDHQAAQAVLGASVFWVRRLAALGGEDEAVGYWQVKRDGGKRGIVEIILETP